MVYPKKLNKQQIKFIEHVQFLFNFTDDISDYGNQIIGRKRFAVNKKLMYENIITNSAINNEKEYRYINSLRKFYILILTKLKEGNYNDIPTILYDIKEQFVLVAKKEKLTGKKIHVSEYSASNILKKL